MVYKPHNQALPFQQSDYYRKNKPSGLGSEKVAIGRRRTDGGGLDM